MLYLGIDLHAKQFTVNLRDENGEVVLRRQVSTAGDQPRLFLEDVARRAGDGGFVAMLEVCGFHDWLSELLPKCGCRDVILVQAEQRSRRKTDKRDASQLSEILWVNSQRLLAGLKVQGVRRITPATPAERHDRRLTQLRRNIGADRTRTLNAIQHILRRLNFTQHCPTKGIQTVKARHWLRTLALPELDRSEMNRLLHRLEWLDDYRQELEGQIARRALENRQAQLLETVPGVAPYIALAIASRVGKLNRFPSPRSLANYFGLTPSCRNSGETSQRLGSITKEGSVLVRALLGQLVIHVLRCDPLMRGWYQQIKKRRGSKIARVAVMRRLTVIFWHMFKHDQPYAAARPQKAKPSPRRPRASSKAAAKCVKAVIASPPDAAAAASLGALPPDPRDLSLVAPCELGQPAAEAPPATPKKTSLKRRSRGAGGAKKTSGRSSPSALRNEPGAGARVASQQSPILPSG